MAAIKSTGAPRGSVLLAFGVHLKTTVQAPVDYMGTVGIYPHSILADTFALFQSGGGRLTPPHRFVPTWLENVPPGLQYDLHLDPARLCLAYKIINNHFPTMGVPYTYWKPAYNRYN